METWLPVVGFEGLYEVSDLGRVRSLDREVRYIRNGREQTCRYTGKLIAQHIHGRHYKVELSNGDRVRGSRHNFYVHHLVLEAFVGPRPNGAFGLHWDDDYQNNRVGNLRWGDRSKNTLDSVRLGTHNQSRKTHCPQGHEYTPENTHTHPKSGRQCRICGRERNRRQRRSHQ